MQTLPLPTVGSAPVRRPDRRREAGFTGLQVLGLVLVAVLVTAGVTVWLLRTHFFAREFEPVQLSLQEQHRLDSKLRALGIDPPPPPVAAGRHEARASDRGWLGSRERVEEAPEEAPEEWLRPERYAEDPSKREIGLTERELNALLAHNTRLAERLAIDLSDDLASARLLVPVDPDFPVFGGRILRVAAGLELSYAEGRPVVIMRGVSLMGVPIPNAWLGNLKNVDLVREFGGGPGVWKSFADGVEFAQIREGELKIKLRE